MEKDTCFTVKCSSLLDYFNFLVFIFVQQSSSNLTLNFRYLSLTAYCCGFIWCLLLDHNFFLTKVELKSCTSSHLPVAVWRLAKIKTYFHRLSILKRGLVKDTMAPFLLISYFLPCWNNLNLNFFSGFFVSLSKYHFA